MNQFFNDQTVTKKSVGAIEARIEKAAPEVDPPIAVIDPRTLERECFVRCLAQMGNGIEVEGHASIEDWDQSRHRLEPRVVLFNINRKLLLDAQMRADLARLVGLARPTPVLVIGETEDIREMIEAFDCGAHGYIPSSAGFETIVEATRLSFSGGVFLPLASLPALRSAFVSRPNEDAEVTGQFTSRQLAVSNALRLGQSNKMIAYQLNLCESTVKVHIRNILKKLKATNRTEAAFKLNAIYFGSRESGPRSGSGRGTEWAT